jgi:hypothetical protein
LQPFDHRFLIYSIFKAGIFFRNGFVVVTERFLVLVAFEMTIAGPQGSIAQYAGFYLVGLNPGQVAFNTVNTGFKVGQRIGVIF